MSKTLQSEESAFGIFEITTGILTRDEHKRFNIYSDFVIATRKANDLNEITPCFEVKNIKLSK